MNGYQTKQVDRILTKIPDRPITKWEADFAVGLKAKYRDKELSPKQNSTLNDIVKKFS